MIAQSTIDQINAIELLDVVKAYVPDLKRKGSSYQACCPFHDEKTPSFSVNPTKEIYKCHGCGEGGKFPLQFVQAITKLEFPEAVKDVAGKFGISVQYEQYDSDQEKQKATNKADLYKLNQAAARQYQKQLNGDSGHAARKLLQNRFQLTADQLDELIITWGLGYAPDAWDFLTKAINEKGLNEQAHQIDLIKFKNEKYYDTLRHRIVFPIHDTANRIVGFGGRAMGDEKPKYLNPKESPLYHKSKVLYGLNQAIKSIKNQGFAYLVEGYTDVIAWHQCGVRNTISTSGTALTPEQAKIIKRYTDHVVLVYDGDKAGRNAIDKAIEILLPLSLTVDVMLLPDGEDPDSFTRLPWKHSNFADFVAWYGKQDAVLFTAEWLLAGVTNLAKRNNGFNQVARILAKIPAAQKALRSDYIRKIAKAYKQDVGTLRQLVDDQLVINERKEFKEKKVKKNAVTTLNGNSTIYPFFEEVVDNQGRLKDLKINLVKFVNLLASFGYTRYDVNDTQDYNFVHLQENIISSVKPVQIFDHLEKFIKNDYDFEGAGCGNTEAEDLLNKLYKGMRSYFSKDLFARMRLDQPIIINEDQKDTAYFYYKNGFVTVTKDGWQLQPYDKMNGSVWQDQMLDREFTSLFEQYDYNNTEIDPTALGVMADFVYRISDAYKAEQTDDESKQREYWERFYSLCSIIGYIIHDFYDYKLKAILLTDSSLSDESDGRSGKTLLGKLIGCVRSYCEINGKDFDINDKNKYESATLGTQVLHLNDVKTKGRNRFDFEAVFNDVTEGYVVNAKYMTPFHNYSKMVISTNKTLNISGGSQRDRIIEFEVSSFFNESHSPQQQYGHWLMKDWDPEEWNRFDNFMCFCSRLFLEKGIIAPSTINLEMRKLIDHTSQEFIDFMNDIAHNLKTHGKPFDSYAMPDSNGMFAESEKPQYTINNFEFDKAQLYHQFQHDFEDYKANWFTQNLFTKWLKMYSKLALGVAKPTTRRSNGKNLIMFKEQ